MRPVVLLDMDGVVVDFQTPFLALVNDEMGTSHCLDGMTKWDLYDSFDVPQDVRDKVDTVIDTPGFCESLHPYDGAIDGVERLRQFAEIYIVTSPWSSDTWAAERSRWIKRHLGFGKDHVVSTRAKHIVAGDVLVDDKPETLDRWAVWHPHSLPIMWHGPANARAVTLHQRCDDWRRLVDIVRGRARGPTMRFWTQEQT